jgi:hypothetical protein
MFSTSLFLSLGELGRTPDRLQGANLQGSTPRLPITDSRMEHTVECNAHKNASSRANGTRLFGSKGGLYPARPAKASTRGTMIASTVPGAGISSRGSDIPHPSSGGPRVRNNHHLAIELMSAVRHHRIPQEVRSPGTLSLTSL